MLSFHKHERIMSKSRILTIRTCTFFLSKEFLLKHRRWSRIIQIINLAHVHGLYLNQWWKDSKAPLRTVVSGIQMQHVPTSELLNKVSLIYGSSESRNNPCLWKINKLSWQAISFISECAIYNSLKIAASVLDSLICSLFFHPNLHRCPQQEYFRM